MIVLDNMNLYTPAEAAALIGVSPQAIHSMIRRGEMKAVIISGKRHVSADEVKAAAERQRGRVCKDGA